MKDLILEGTTKTPEVIFKASTGVLTLRGRSIPEISFETYQPLLDWVKEYSSQPCPETLFLTRMEYFNTSSSKSILDIFYELEKLHNSGKSKVTIKWYFDADDESMEEAGEEYKKLISIPFEIIEEEEEEEEES